jgi:hypothetical protein
MCLQHNLIKERSEAVLDLGYTAGINTTVLTEVTGTDDTLSSCNGRG